MSKYAGEQVLVVPRALFDEIGAFEGIRTEDLNSAVDRLLDPQRIFSWTAPQPRMTPRTNS